MPADIDLLPGDAVRAVASLTQAFEARSIQYALIGGLAYALRGRPRFTKDVVFLLEVPQLALPGLLQELVARGCTLDPAGVIQEFVREHMTSFRYRDARIDWLKPVLPLYTRVLREAGVVEWAEGLWVRTATAEGVILTKMVAFRPQDQLDIDSLLTANRDDIDVAIIREEWAPYADTEPERTAWLESAIERRVVRRE
jgi:hypothetical protein